MKQEKERNGIDLTEVSIHVDVNNGVVEKVRIGEITYINASINEHNQELFLQTIDGQPVLTTKKTPKKWRGCYFYNNGEFPYAIKESLDFLILEDEEDTCLAQIIGVETNPGYRFRFKGADNKKVEDPKGDCCIWEVNFEIIPVQNQMRRYLMRWNPSISSFKERDFEECVANKKYGVFRLSWSINEWDEARKGDLFCMMRVGDENAGIVCVGQFISDPYPADDWAGSTKRRMYVDMICTSHTPIGEKPHITLDKLQHAIPEFDWAEGHSGVLLSEELADKLEELLME